VYNNTAHCSVSVIETNKTELTVISKLWLEKHYADISFNFVAGQFCVCGLGIVIILLFLVFVMISGAFLACLDDTVLGSIHICT
jgi:hypothetical protein